MVNIRITRAITTSQLPIVKVNFEDFQCGKCKSWLKNVTIFGADMSSSVNANNKNKSILILGKGQAKGLDNTLLTTEAQYSINFSRSERKVCLSFYYNESNSFLFVNASNIHQFTGKDSK